MDNIDKENRQRKFRSLTITLALVFMILSATVLFVSSIINIYFSFRAQQQSLFNQQQIIARDAANEVKGFILEKINKIESGTRLCGLVPSNSDERKIFLERLIGSDPAFRQAIFLDELGNETARVNRLSGYSTDQLMEKIDNNEFPGFVKGDESVSTIYINEFTNEPLITISVPIKDALGELKGSLVGEVNLKFMWDLVGGIKVGEEGDAYVVDKGGNLIAFEDVGRVLKRENLKYLDEVNEFVTGKSPEYNYDVQMTKGIYGDYVVTTHEELQNPDWAVVVEMPVSEAYRNIITQIRLSIIFLILSLVVTMVVGILISKKITKPIIGLRNTATELGRGNLDARIEKQFNNEIGQLADSFNRMAVDLKKSKMKIDEYNRELEEKVEERTKALKLKNKELQKFNKLVVGRELKMVELKKKVKKMEGNSSSVKL